MLRIGTWLFDAATRRLVRKDENNKLSPKAASVLLALAEIPGQVWSRDALIERCWPGVTVGEEVLTHAVAELRRALGDDFRCPRFLETVHKAGYRLTCGALSTPGIAGDETADNPDPGARFSLATYARYLTAYELYDRGGRENMARAVALFTSLVREDPDFSLAHAGYAKALTFSQAYYAPGTRLLDEALDHCVIAHKLSNGFADAYAAEGLVFALAGQSAKSAGSFRRALALDPNSAETHYLLGRASLAELQFDTAGIFFERAAALKPDGYHSLLLAGKVWLKLGEVQRAKSDFAAALSRIEARFSGAEIDYRALCGRARCLWQLGRREEAHALMEKIAAHPDPMNYHLACTFACAGEHDRALDVLEQVVELGWRHPAWLERDPDFDALRSLPRFKRIEGAIRATH